MDETSRISPFSRYVGVVRRLGSFKLCSFNRAEHYVVYIIPGLIMMAWVTNAFANSSSSLMQQKFQRSIDDQLSSPASPMELLLGFSLGGFLRGGIVAIITFIDQLPPPAEWLAGSR